MKRTIGTAALILLVMLSLAGCGKKKSEEGSSQEAGVSAATNVTLPEDGETVAYVLAARMVSDYLGSEAFVPETGAGGNTLWTTVGYLFSAYGAQNERISTSEDGLSYEVSLEQLRYYAAALYADLGKAKDLPELTETTMGVTRQSKKKYVFSIVDTAQYRALINSSAETDDGYKINASLMDSASGDTVAQYAATVKKSAYTGKKSPFHYAVASLSRMTKMPVVQVLVGQNKAGAEQSTAEGQTQDGGQTAPDGQTAPTGEGAGTTDGTQTPAASDSGGSSSDSGSSSTDGGAPAGSSSSAAGDSASGGSAGTDGGSSSTDGGAGGDSSSGQGTSQPSDGGTGGGISNGSALERARDYFGTTDEESGKTYVYSYEGTTTFNSTDYYNFNVTDGESYVTNILVSYDGSRILKGTKNADGSWNLQ